MYVFMVKSEFDNSVVCRLYLYCLGLVLFFLNSFGPLTFVDVDRILTAVKLTTSFLETCPL